MKPSRIALLALAAAVLSTGSAEAADTTLAADAVTATACHTTFRGGEPGVATTEFTVPGPGTVDAALDAAEGDWDLALFDASGRAIGAGASSTAHEVASGFVLESGTVRVQACRRGGDAGQAKVRWAYEKLPDVKPEPLQMVEVKTPTRADKDRLVDLDLDMTEHGHGEGLGVVLHGKKDEQRLRRAGFTWKVEIPDLARKSLEDRRAEARTTAKAAGVGTDVPGPERTTYRTLADYEDELKTLATANPGLVKLIELPNKTFLGRTVMGIEITENVNVPDGKPAFLNMGVHHAREWPSGEHAMTWAYELIEGFKNGDERITNIVKGSRNYVVPIVNPDGFNASRSAGGISGADGGRDESVPDTAYIVAGASNGGEYRRKNCRVADDSDTGNCLTSAGLAESGVDPNRNYGGLWGGPGADQTNPLAQTYPGTGPFSEPESQNIKSLVGSNQITTLITNHTTAGLVLRAPGLAALGDPVDENRGYKALGDAMAFENGYFSQKSFELYDTTGTTEDWTYNTAGGFGFTFEIYCGAPNYTTGDCDDPAFHPRYATQVEEYTGESAQSDHETDPGNSEETPFGMEPDYDGKGNREAYLIAAESTLDEERHSIIEGSAPAGATLRIKKTFKTETFPQEDGEPILFDDALESSIVVGDDGQFRWHTNPSTRPIVAKERGDENGGDPSPAEQQTGSPLGNDDPADYYTDEAPGAAPSGDAESTNPLNYNDHQIVVPDDGGDNRSANIRVSWTTPATDYDIKLFEDSDGDGRSAGETKSVGVSENGATSEEEVGLTGDPELEPGKQYVLRVTNFAGVEPYTVDVTWNGPEPFVAAQKENWTLTCEVGGEVLQTTEVYVDRGEAVTPDLSACRKEAGGSDGGSDGGSGGSGGSSGGGSGSGSSDSGSSDSGSGAPLVGPPAPADARTEASATPTCVGATGFSAANATPKGGSVAVTFDRKANAPVTVDVFQQSVGRQVIGERLVARFTNKTDDFTWDGKANREGRTVTDGYYFLRYRIAQPEGGTDVRRVTLRRVDGQWSTRKAFFLPDACGVVRSFKLTRPVFGGRGNREVAATFRLTRPSEVKLELLHDGEVVRTLSSGARRAGVTHRVRLAAEGLETGDHQFRLTAVEGGRTVVLTLTSRRL